MAHHTASHLSAEMQRCIDECLHCHATCVATTAHCLALGGEHAEAAHIRLLTDCAEICRTSAGFMLRGSDLHERICAVCADICRRCADDCERVGPDDQMMQDCAAECRRCADSCERMANEHRVF
jgi:hypothetical protein